MKKKLQRLFKEYDPEITVESNLKIVNYLDVTFNLKDGTFRPYHKPDDQIQYIHTESNHLPNIIKHVTASTETHLSNLSSTEIIFKESTKQYENNLRQSGYNKKLTHKPTDTNHQKHSKHREKSYGLIHRLAKMFLQNRKIFFKPVRPTFPKKPHLL